MPDAPLVERAPAKLNLGLAITGTRPDGYHELRSIFVRAGLADELSAAIDLEAATDTLLVTGDPGCPVDDNLVLRAAALARESFATHRPRLRFTLAKRIPLAAGLGGGSSDAAAALRLCLLAWGISVDAEHLDALGLRLGADVPFFLQQEAAALVGGIGERLKPLPAPSGTPAAVLVTPAFAISTRDAFAAFDTLEAAHRPRSGPSATVDAIAAAAGALVRGVDGDGFAELVAGLRDANNLWPAATVLQPGLTPLRDRLERLLDRPVLLTGSGSTLFAVYPSYESAKDGERRLRAQSVGEGLDHTRLIAAVPIETQPREDHP